MKRISHLLSMNLVIFNSASLFVQSAEGVSDEKLLELYRGTRVANVVDGLARVGYTGIGVMDPKIVPLWSDVKDMSHRFAGVAGTRDS